MPHSDSSQRFEQAYRRLDTFCAADAYVGWDPYDGLTSRLFQATPLKHWDLARWAWIQLFKLSPINFRPLVGISKTANPKAIALLISASVHRYRLLRQTSDSGEALDRISQHIRQLVDQLVACASPGYSGACWGYNFDWQARRLFLFPAGTPNVVVTSFCVEALHEAQQIISDPRLDDLICSAARFIRHDLNQTSRSDGVFLSYSPLVGNDTVYNASLLGARVLCRAFSRDADGQNKALADDVVAASLAGQRSDGAWEYGLHPVQNWIDSFHTGFMLEGLQAYRETFASAELDAPISTGLAFYLENFFGRDGRPNYYPGRPFPIDIHSPAQLPVTLAALGCFQQHQQTVEQVLNWTLTHMQAADGSFFYQRRKFFVSKVPYLRWSNAFMLRALACYSLNAQAGASGMVR
ncbi:MAG: hypothetical protein AB8C46_26355 [Burkholderiaceae bacterium]